MPAVDDGDGLTSSDPGAGGTRRSRVRSARREIVRVTSRGSDVRLLRRRIGRRLDPIRIRYRRGMLSRRARIGLFGTAAVLGLGIIWIFVTALLARQQAKAIEARLSQVKIYIAQGDVAQARKLAEPLPAMARRAERLTSGPAWFVAAHIPLAGGPFETAQATTDAASAISGRAVPELMKVAAALNPQSLRASGTSIRIGPLADSAGALERAAATIRSATDELAASPAHTWLGSVDDGREKLLSQFRVVQGYVDAAARTAKVLPVMLGADTPKRYFIGLQNESELRGTGGLPGAFAIAVASKGTVKFTRFESDAVLLPDKTGQRIPTGLDFGTNYNDAYGGTNPTASFQDSNVSPHFPYAAQIWAAMWTKVSGERVDGAIALDPTTLAYFLNAMGPTRVSSTGGVITGQNVVALTEQIQYSVFTDNNERRAFVVSVLKAVADKLESGAGNPVDLLRAASVASTQQRLLVWSRDPTVQRALEQTNYAGAIPETNRPFAGLVLNNASGGKVDFYLKRTLTYSRTGCGPIRDVIAHYTIRNDAPASGLPPYVVTRLDNPPAGTRPGGVHQIVDYYGTKGAVFVEVLLNGKPTAAAALTGRGHPIFRLDLEIPQGSTQDIVFKIKEPVGSGTPYIWQQPGVNPIEVRAFDAPC